MKNVFLRDHRGMSIYILVLVRNRESLKIYLNIMVRPFAFISNAYGLVFPILL